MEVLWDFIAFAVEAITHGLICGIICALIHERLEKKGKK